MVKKNSIIEEKTPYRTYAGMVCECCDPKTESDNIFVYFAGRWKKDLGMGKHITVGLQELSPVVPVDDALIGNKLAVDILVVHDLAMHNMNTIHEIFSADGLTAQDSSVQGIFSIIVEPIA